MAKIKFLVNLAANWAMPAGCQAEICGFKGDMYREAPAAAAVLRIGAVRVRSLPAGQRGHAGAPQAKPARAWPKLTTARCTFPVNCSGCCATTVDQGVRKLPCYDFVCVLDGCSRNGSFSRLLGEIDKQVANGTLLGDWGMILLMHAIAQHQPGSGAPGQPAREDAPLHAANLGAFGFQRGRLLRILSIHGVRPDAPGGPPASEQT